MSLTLFLLNLQKLLNDNWYYVVCFVFFVSLIYYDSVFFRLINNIPLTDYDYNDSEEEYDTEDDDTQTKITDYYK